jgi:hypothetical protein
MVIPKHDEIRVPVMVFIKQNKLDLQKNVEELFTKEKE